MKKSIYLFSLVMAALVMGLAEAVSGFVLWFALPEGNGKRGLESVYLGLTRHTWTDIHDWVAIALIVAVIIHFIIHWKWVVRMVKYILTQFTEAFRSLRSDSNLSSNS